jgi:hypothetical protein
LDVTFVVGTALPDLPVLTVNPALPGLTALPGPRALMASQAQTERLVDGEPRVQKGRPARRELRALRVDPETANIFLPTCSQSGNALLAASWPGVFTLFATSFFNFAGGAVSFFLIRDLQLSPD